MPESTLPTIGAIADQLGVRIHQIAYILRTRRIEPIGRAGGARVYSEAAVDHIRRELQRARRRVSGARQ